MHILICKRLSCFALMFFMGTLFLLPFANLYAQNESAVVPNKTNTPAVVPNKQQTTTESSGVRLDTKINNPLGDNIKDIPTFIQTIIGIVLVIGVPIVTLAIIYSGYLFVVARGVPEELSRAKKNLTYTLIGAALLFGAFVISKAIKGTVDQIIRENK